ncbi:MAG: CTP synthase C-terminal region-related (seleno)protein [Blastocatellia bacterium]
MLEELKIGVIGDFNPENRSHINTNSALRHTASQLSAALKLDWLPTPALEGTGGESLLKQYDGLWCSPGSPYRSMDGALNAIRCAREQSVPFIGTCGGFQHTVIEYARNVLGYKDAEHEESNPYASRLLVSRLVCSVFDKTLTVKLKPGSRVREIVGRDEINEHYYCNFGVNPEFKTEIDLGGLKITGSDSDDEPRVVELPDHPFFIATLFLPQDSSSETAPHPIIVGFLKAAMAFASRRPESEPARVVAKGGD